MKIMTVLGTRPEIIRLSRIIEKLDKVSTHVLVHTGQNYAESLNDMFFRELGVRPADVNLGIRSESAGEQIGRIIAECERILQEHRPDRLLILGDTNSGLAAIPAKRLGIPVFHMEAGNRCYDDRVPEEINRRIIDHCSDVLLPYTFRSKENLVREGIVRERIYVIGNPINEVLNHYKGQIAASDILAQLGVAKKHYFLVTIHRAENVDQEDRLRNLIKGLELVAAEYKMPVICSLHPRTKSKMMKFGLSFENRYLRWLTPLGLFDFVALEQGASCVLSDSGTVQEECCIFGVPNVTLRDVTERPETVECGSNVLSGENPEQIFALVQMLLSNPRCWDVPPEYLERDVSSKMVNILLGHHHWVIRR